MRSIDETDVSASDCGPNKDSGKPGSVHLDGPACPGPPTARPTGQAPPGPGSGKPYNRLALSKVRRATSSTGSPPMAAMPPATYGTHAGPLPLPPGGTRV